MEGKPKQGKQKDNKKKLHEVQKQVDDVTGVMRDNIGKALKNIEEEQQTEKLAERLDAQSKRFEKSAEKVELAQHWQTYGKYYRLLIGFLVTLFVILCFVPGINAVILSGALLTAAQWVASGSIVHGIVGCVFALTAGAFVAFLDHIVSRLIWIVGESIKAALSHLAVAINTLASESWHATKWLWEHVKPLALLGLIFTVIIGIPAAISTGLAILGEGIRWFSWVLSEKSVTAKNDFDSDDEHRPKRNAPSHIREDYYENKHKSDHNIFDSAKTLMNTYADESLSFTRNERNPDAALGLGK